MKELQEEIALGATFGQELHWREMIIFLVIIIIFIIIVIIIIISIIITEDFVYSSSSSTISWQIDRSTLLINDIVKIKFSSQTIKHICTVLYDLLCDGAGDEWQKFFAKAQSVQIMDLCNPIIFCKLVPYSSSMPFDGNRCRTCQTICFYSITCADAETKHLYIF